MKNLKSVCLIAFTLFFSHSSYAVSLNSIQQTLSKYCVGGCTGVPNEEPSYKSSAVGKPTQCLCSAEKGYVYDINQRKCKKCEMIQTASGLMATAATEFAVDCQPIKCPSGYYGMAFTTGCPSGYYAVNVASGCPSGMYGHLLVNSKVTYVKE